MGAEMMVIMAAITAAATMAAIVFNMTAPCSGFAPERFALDTIRLGKALIRRCDWSHRKAHFRRLPMTSHWIAAAGEKVQVAKPRPCGANGGRVDPGLWRELPFMPGH